MSSSPTPRLILETLFPHLKVVAAYARTLQPKISALPAKAQKDNLFTAALTDADLSIQNMIEVVLLANFPEIRFFGEEYEQSRNTKYFRAIDLGSTVDYLVTLDPIDGTKFYLDGHGNYQIILSILNGDDFEGVLAISPAQNTYYYALGGHGAHTGSLSGDWEDAVPLEINPRESTIYLGLRMDKLKPFLEDRYEVIDLANCYSTEVQIPNLNGILTGDVCAAAVSSAQFIDAGALAFIAREAGYLVTTLDGSPLPPLHSCKGYRLPGLIIAATTEVHQHLLQAARNI